MKYLWLMIVFTLSWQSNLFASELDKVLQQVKQGSLAEQKAAEQRVQQVQGEFKQAQKRLMEAQTKLQQTNADNIALEDQILQRQEILKQRRNQYQSQRESMDSVFKHVVEHGDLMLQRVSPHGLWQFDQSSFIRSGEKSVDISHIKSLWLALLEQTVLSGKAIRIKQDIVLANGKPESALVTQYGPFNAYTDSYSNRDNSAWLEYLPSEKVWMVMSPQPTLELTSQQVIIDPSFGALLDKQAHMPNLLERILPAGVVGVLIVLIGLIGATIALVRGLALRRVKQQINAQITDTQAHDDNALGRVILAIQHCPNTLLEAVIDEAVLKEIPYFKMGLGSLAVFAGIPPLLGLLGTVGGMIETFRVITEHGGADSQLLSGGISQALLTTEMGLIVAVPLLLLHCGLKAQSTHLIEVLEQQSAGLIVIRQQAHAQEP